MLCSVKRIRGQPIVAADGRIGSIVDVYFDDAMWSVRYFVLDTRHAMPQRQVLVARAHVAPSDDGRIEVRLTRRQLELCPGLEDDPPVFLQHDMTGIRACGDPHLRSAEVVTGFAVHGPLGRGGGRLKDLLVDTADWSVKSLVVETGIWLPGERSLVAPSDVQRVDWIERAVEIGELAH